MQQNQTGNGPAVILHVFYSPVRKLNATWGELPVEEVTIAEMLLVREILDGNEVTQLIKGQTLAPPTPKETPGGGVQQVIRPETGRRVPGLNEGSQPA